jgi:hypothetical protein
VGGVRFKQAAVTLEEVPDNHTWDNLSNNIQVLGWLVTHVIREYPESGLE